VTTAVLLAVLLSSACGDSPTEPTPAAVFRMRGPGGVFRVGADNSEVIREGERLLATGEAVFAVGRPRAGDGGFNSPWHWHLDPGTLTFAVATIEACQTAPGGLEGPGLDYWIRFGQACVGGRVEARER
jgi:hypothetical protein